MLPMRFALILGAILVFGAATVALIVLLPPGARLWLLPGLILAGLAARVTTRTAARPRRKP